MEFADSTQYWNTSRTFSVNFPKKDGLEKIFLMLNDFCNRNNDLWENDMSVTLDVAADLTKIWKDSPGNPTEVDPKAIFIDHSLHRPAAIGKRLLLSLEGSKF